jgi:hypothetical protein
MMEVSSSLGIMIEVDWQGLFNSFFSMVRVKIQCKDPTKIPKQRVFVFKSNLYLVEFKAEGFEQVDNPPDDGSNKGGGEEEPEESETQDGGAKDSDKSNKSGTEESKKNPEVGQSSAGDLTKKGCTSGNKSIKRVLVFDDEGMEQQDGTLECVGLLKAMELVDEGESGDEREDNFDTLLQEDEELTQLPEEWIFDLQELSKESLSKSGSSSAMEGTQIMASNRGEEGSKSILLKQGVVQDKGGSFTQPEMSLQEKAEQQKGKRAQVK